jgi:hypothetical protein
MNYFKIFAHGTDFDVDAFLASTHLRPDKVWRRGDQRAGSFVGSRHPTSGVEFVLGDGPNIPVREQERIAVAYLAAHQEELLALGRAPGAKTFILGLHYRVEVSDGTLGFSVGPSTRLMRSCLDVGAVPVYHVALDRQPPAWRRVRGHWLVRLHRRAERRE